jgi:hypothetical protein
VERGPSRPHERRAVDVDAGGTSRTEALASPIDAGCETDVARLMSCLVLSRAARSSYSTSPRGRSPGRMRPSPPGRR